MASYFKLVRGISDTLTELINGIRRIGEIEIILVPRYDYQREWALKKFGGRCVVPKTTIDGARAIGEADLLIGGGGTMTQEAALLGVPNISYFPSANLYVFSNYYFPKKLSIRASNPSQLIRSSLSILRNLESVKSEFLERARSETMKYEDPVRSIFDDLLAQK